MGISVAILLVVLTLVDFFPTELLLTIRKIKRWLRDDIRKRVTARQWEAATGKTLFTFASHEDTVIDIAFSPDNGFTATCSADKTIRPEHFIRCGHTN